MDVWLTGEEAAFSEMRSCIEPLLFSYLLDETHDLTLSRRLLEEALARLQFGAYQHGTDVISWALDVAARLAHAHEQHAVATAV
jgi:hypothetical protein